MKNETSRGFTLIELLIVVVVIATLMGLVFRLAGVGSEQAARNNTITRMQKLEFALSGYYAAFGSYPPVPLHGSRDIRCKVSQFGVQYTNGDRETGPLSDEKTLWPCVRAACLSQPVACEFPYNGENKSIIEGMERLAATFSENSWPKVFGSFDVLPNNASRLNNADSASWTDVQVFKFGVMSFLLPRYLFMVAGPDDLYDAKGGGDRDAPGKLNAQWRSQNDLGNLFSFKNGKRLYTVKDGWKKLQEDTHQRKNTKPTANDYDNREYRAILMQPSQAVCARWMQALDGIVSGGRTFYGVNTLLDHDDRHIYHHHENCEQPKLYMLSGVYAPGQNNSQGGNAYILDGMTVRDGWGMDLFYYSLPPYQSYRLWSAGPNGKTIPPWVDLSSSEMAADRKTAAEWMSDDIVGLSTPAN